MESPLPAVARVLCDASGPPRTFDYLIPEAMADRVEIGSLVRVDLHGRRIGGWVVEVDPTDALDEDRLLPLRRITGTGPDRLIIDLATWAAHRWAGRPSQFLRTASPARAVTAVPPARYTSMNPEPRSPATSRLLDQGGGVLRLPPGADPLPAIWSCVTRGPTLVITPGVDDGSVLAGRIRRAGVSVGLWPDEWERAAGGVDVVVGARSAVFARVPNLASIIVLDEHDDRLQSEASPTWHAREVAVERARQLDVPVILISPVPTPEGRHERPLESPERQREIASWPEIVVVDPTDHDGPARGSVSSALLAEVRNPERRVLCVTNTPGRSALLACRQCRDLARCEHCDATMVLPTSGDLICRRCGSSRPPICASCGAGTFINLRAGAARMAREIGAATTRPVQLIDGDATPDWRPNQTGSPSDVIVGTEAVLYRVRTADTVVFLDIDAELFAPRFRAVQQVLGLIARAATVVGDRRRGGRIIIQSRQVDHPVLGHLAAADPGSIGELETSVRREFSLPPFGSLAFVEGAEAQAFAGSLPPSVLVGGNGDRIQVRASSPEVLADALASGQRPTRSRLRVAVEPAR